MATPLWYSCLENSMDRGACRAANTSTVVSCNSVNATVVVLKKTGQKQERRWTLVRICKAVSPCRYRRVCSTKDHHKGHEDNYQEVS